jgi:hypothetical protein
VVTGTSRPLYPRDTDTVPIIQEAGWIPVPVWMDVENLAPTGIRSPTPQCSLQRVVMLQNYAISAPKFVLQAIMRKCTRDLTAAAIMWLVRGPATALPPSFLLAQPIFEPNFSRINTPTF